MQIEKADVEQLQRILKKNYGVEFNFKEFNVYQNKEGKIYLVSKGIDRKMVEKSIRAGLYFGKIKRNEKIQLSVEGAQLIGGDAKKNVVVVDKKNLLRFMEGFDVVPRKLIECEEHNFVLVTNGRDFFGCGLLAEGKVRSLVPKGRRIYTTLKKV